MSKETLYLKYRPLQLEDVVGQKYNTATLKQASIHNKFTHAYLMAGARGTGKTTLGRILANLVNCENPKDGKVCCECRACKTIQNGVAMDFIELDGAANGNVEHIQAIIEGANWSPTELKKKVIVVDECLGRNSRVDTEYGLLGIDKIVKNKMDIRVKSWNHKDNKIEYKKITGWFKNSGKMINKVLFNSDGILYASDGHLILTPFGYKKVKDICVGDYVYRIGDELSYCQNQLVYGSMLGDASISKCNSKLKKARNTNPRIRFVHGKEQKNYLDFKYEILKNFVFSCPRQYFHKGFANYPKIETWRFNTKSLSQLNEVYKDTTISGKKTISKEWLSKIDWMGIAFWFCDDGSVSKKENKKNNGYSVTFHTQGFSYRENEILQEWLLKLGISCSIAEETRNGHKLFRLKLNQNNSEVLLNKIWKFIPQCMEFKLNGYVSSGKKYFTSENDFSLKSGIFLEKIREKKEFRIEETTYDIEVEDNHNYFVSGTLVHNCQQLSSKAISALLKIVEEPPEYLIFVFCTTDPKKLPPTILSRSQRFNFKKITSKDIVGRLDYIAKQEKIQITEQALFEIAKISRGHMRDAIMSLEQISTIISGKEITDVHVQKYFGLSDRQGIMQIITAMVEGNMSLVMDQVNDMIVASADIESIVFEITEAFRSIMILKAQNGQTKLIDLPEHEIQNLLKIGESVKMGQLDKLARLFSTIKKELEYSINDRWILESTLIHGIALLRKT